MSKDTFDAVLKISIDPTTDEILLFKTINDIDVDLYAQISKVQDEISFYRKFSNYNPLKKFISLTFLSLQYILSLAIVFGVIFLLVNFLLSNNWILDVVMVIIVTIGFFLIDKLIKK